MKDLNGIWSVTFSSHILKFTGILILEDSRALGGDVNYIYSGKYKFQDGKFASKVRVKKYNDSLKTLLPNKYIVDLKGEYTDDTITLSGKSDMNDELIINASCRRQGDLNTK